MNPIAAAVAAAREEQARHPPSPPRLTSLDAFRGLAMFLLIAEWLELPKVARHFTSNAFWQTVGRHSEHVEWTGCTLHDLIQPAFSFMVGVAVPFSMASRLARGHSRARLWWHAAVRAALLIGLGIFLRSVGRPMTNWTFEDTLTQIGLGYPALFALAFLPRAAQWSGLGVILGGYWLAFALFPLPPDGFDWARHHAHAFFEGFAAHWNRNTNAAWAFDCWFLNLFPRTAPFTGNPGGYVTLSFIPTLGTMLLGLIAGGWLLRWSGGRDTTVPADEPAPHPGKPLGKLAAAAALCLALGWAADRFSICPSVKRIWTPSWTLFSGGWCLLGMAVFHLAADIAGWRRLFFPLVVIGMNSIAMYVLTHSFAGFISEALETHLGRGPFLWAGEAFEPLLHGACVVAVLWLIAWWMHRRRLFLKI